MFSECSSQVTSRPVGGDDGFYPYFRICDDRTARPRRRYLRAADQVAHQLKPCGTAPVDAVCLEVFLRKTLPRAWRRPIAEDEIAGIMNLFQLGLEISPVRALEVTMEVV